MASTGPMIPVEIYLEIIGYIKTPKDLLSIALVNRTLHNLALPLLYRNLGKFYLNPKYMVSLLQRLEHNEQLARAVRSLRCVVPNNSTHRLAFRPHILHLALSATVNLSALEIAVGAGIPWDTLCSCPFRLRELKLSWAEHDGRGLLRFLETQDSLIRLELQKGTANIHPTKPILPNLRQFRGRTRTAKQLWSHSKSRLPDEMYITDSVGMEALDWLAGHPTEQPISLYIEDPQLSDMQFWTEQECKCVESLVIFFSELQERTFMASRCRVPLASFKNLRTLMFKGLLWPREYEPHGEAGFSRAKAFYLYAVREMWEDCPSLEQASFPKRADRDWVFYRTGDQWPLCWFVNERRYWPAEDEQLENEEFRRGARFPPHPYKSFFIVGYDRFGIDPYAD